jgi:hypothetical protein
VVIRPSPVDSADEPEWPNRVEPAARKRTDHPKSFRFELFSNRFVVAQQRNLTSGAGEESERWEAVNGWQVTY